MKVLPTFLTSLAAVLLVAQSPPSYHITHHKGARRSRALHSDGTTPMTARRIFRKRRG